MAERKSSGGADFVARIVKDPANPPQTALLTGYIGASSEKGYTRLYFDPGLSSYVEIPDDAILHTQDAGDSGGLGATHLWVKRDAELIYGPAGAQRPKGKFLEGPIMQAHMAGAAAGGAAAAAPPHTLLGCPTHAPFLCPTPPAVCASAHIGCPTHAPFLCPTPPAVCASAHIGCPTHAPFLCPTPSAVHHCPPSLPLCPTEACAPSQHIACPPSTHICPTPSALDQCPTVHGPQCPPSAINICPTPSALDQCPTRLCQISQVPQCPPVSGFVCPSNVGCGPSVACVSAACGMPGGGAVAPQALAAAIPPSPFNCPTHAPLFCPVTPQCPPTPHAPCLSHAPCPSVPCLTPHLPCPTHLGCPTHAPQLCPVTPHCPPTPIAACPTHAPLLCPVTPHCPPTPIVACATHAPQLCPITPHCVSVFIACVTQNVLQCVPHITSNPAQCPVATGFACPPVSLGCPVQSVACGLPGGGNPVAGG
jgi:hypothetical protein